VAVAVAVASVAVAVMLPHAAQTGVTVVRVGANGSSGSRIAGSTGSVPAAPGPYPNSATPHCAAVGYLALVVALAAQVAGRPVTVATHSREAKITGVGTAAEVDVGVVGMVSIGRAGQKSTASSWKGACSWKDTK
jgi:hypothetical protein